ncbi:MAG: helix-turn-helix transcriptional regulator [Bacteroidales bacterium]|nr:helix-turn-helix transcriptional regulator [Bacteroidaceae bacterium]MBO5707658.1 helix-turn-helix transcriptional regulator [Bacteroidaceae bacterium]MBO7528287.1 helix-turn-helix transcriptional regulator [Bacteroidales bacterium]MBO7528548.1 helix-turn-helix transcriptional regulator [Bacteroidales bacterium]
MVRNERFRVALDYLYKNGLVADQRELSEKIGVSETSISQILNNRVKKPSESTIRKLNEAFGNIFNPEYFRCNSDQLLSEVERVSEPMSDYVALPTWADALIQMVTEQVKANEDMRRELRQSLEEVASLKQELQNAINKLKS